MDRRTAVRHAPVARCPVRPGDACPLCQPGVTGPQDCGLVWLVRSDPDLLEELQQLQAEAESVVGAHPSELLGFRARG